MEYNEIKSEKVGELAGFLIKQGTPIKEMTIFDFIEKNGVPLNSFHGVYIFRNHDIFFYIGKCSARAFVTRIPSHFEMINQKEVSWFGTLLTYLCQKGCAKSPFEAVMYAKENLSLILIQIEDADIKNCSQIEKLLRLVLQPKLNSYNEKTQNKFNQNCKLDNLSFGEAIKII